MGFGIWYSEFGLRFGIVCWNPEFGLRFSDVSGVIMALQYYLPSLQVSRSLRREDTDFTGRIFIAQGGY